MDIRRFFPVMGSDPEVFLKNKTTGKIVPADNVLPPQDKAIQVASVTGGHGWDYNKLYFDGIQAEVALGPSECRAWVIDNMTCIGRVLYNLAEESNCEIVCEPIVDIDNDVLAQAKDESSIYFGCEPEKLVSLGGGINKVDVDARFHLFRYAGGHIHIGIEKYHKPTPADKLKLIAYMDWVVGTVHVLMQREPDVRRRNIYGLAGSYRETKWGVEYRTPSNLIFRHPSLTNLFFELARLAYCMCYNDVPYTEDYDKIVEAINTGNKKLAYEIFIQLKRQIFNKIDPVNLTDNSKIGLAGVEYCLLNGVDSVVTGSFTKNWHLDDNLYPGHGSLGPTWKYFCAVNKQIEEFNKSYELQESYI